MSLGTLVVVRKVMQAFKTMVARGIFRARTVRIFLEQILSNIVRTKIVRTKVFRTKLVRTKFVRKKN